MPVTTLTDLTVRSLKSDPKRQVIYRDINFRGFGVRISPKGTKTFVLMHGNDRRLKTVGRYPMISLSDARAAAKRFMAEQMLRPEQATATVTVEEALSLYRTLHIEQKNKPSTQRTTWRLLFNHLMTPHKRTTLAELNRQHITRIIDRNLPTPSEAQHAFVAIRAFLRWSVQRGYIAHSPMDGMASPTTPKSRERVLSYNELERIWKAASDYGYPFGYIVKLLLLTGQRRGEITWLRWSYINEQEKTITLPSSLTKNKRVHAFPYGSMVEHLLDVRLDNQDLLFPARGKQDRSFNGFGKCKSKLDAMCGVTDWTLHDLRRSIATHLADADVAPHIIEALLNHASGVISGVAGVYMRSKYLPQMREAVKVWETKLSQHLGK